MKNKALVVIDLQNDITKNYKEIIERVNQAIDWADQNPSIENRRPLIESEKQPDTDAVCYK